MDVEIAKWYLHLSPGMHAVIFVVQGGRVTNEDKKIVDFLIKTFGEGLMNYLIVVFTNKNKLKNEHMTVNEYIKSYDKSSYLRKLIDANTRYIAIGYEGKDEYSTMEGKQILSMVEDIAGKDGNNFYSNEVFRKVQKVMYEKKFKEKIKQMLKNQGISKEELKLIINSLKAQQREDVKHNYNHLFMSTVYMLFSVISGITNFLLTTITSLQGIVAYLFSVILGICNFLVTTVLGIVYFLHQVFFEIQFIIIFTLFTLLGILVRST